jgi:hypothetical protein
MMPIRLRTLFVLALILPSIPGKGIAQEDTIAYPIADKMLRDRGIDPGNRQQVLDSLQSNRRSTRFAAILYCGEKSVHEAVPRLHALFDLFPSVETDGIQGIEGRAIGDRACILRTIIKMDDTTFRNELRAEIDSMAAANTDTADIVDFASFLMKKHNDDYGWFHILPFYDRQEGVDISMLSQLKPFLSSTHRQQVMQIFHKAYKTTGESEVRSFCLRLLLEAGDPEIEAMAIQAVRAEPDLSLKFTGFEILHDIRSRFLIPMFIHTLDTQQGASARELVFTYFMQLDSFEGYRYLQATVRRGDSTFSRWLRLFSGTWYKALAPSDSIPVVILVDSLKGRLGQLADIGWLAEEGLTSQLVGHLSRAVKYLIAKDSLRSFETIKVFQNAVDSVYQVTTAFGPRRLTKEGWTDRKSVV